MPTIHREDGYRFFFYSNEGSEPPHIHVEKGGAVAKYWLEPVLLESSMGFNSGELRHIGEIVRANVEIFLNAWNEYFGT